jgi:glycerophosphoryl diester phosphodiesterase
MFSARRNPAADHPYFDSSFIALAHRGGALPAANLHSENTLYAFTKASELGFRYLETDVHVTADGVPIAFHDERLDRVTDGTGLVAELPWAEVSRSRIGGQHPIARLAELLEAFPDHRFNIDIKARAAVGPLVRTINEYRAHDRVCVGSFSIDRIREFRRLMGAQVATSVASSGVAWTRFVPFLPRLLNDPGVVLQIPSHWPVTGRSVRLVTPALVQRAHAAGKHVHVWTIDTAEEMHELIDLGVDGLVSDRIDVLKDVCIARGLW